MGWFRNILNPKSHQSASVAKNRLQMVLSHDRFNISPQLIEEIKDDIIAIFVDRFSIDADAVEIHITRTPTESRLVAEIPILTPSRHRIARRAKRN